jgi:hypothetical protein
MSSSAASRSAIENSRRSVPHFAALNAGYELSHHANRMGGFYLDRDA